MTSLTDQIVTLLLLALPIACVAWTVTHEEVFREPREFCAHRSKNHSHLILRKFFYLPTCEYCFSHYVTAGFLVFTKFKLVSPGRFGYVIAFFALVLVANFYMALFFRLKLSIKNIGAQAKVSVAMAQAVQDAEKMTAWSHTNAPHVLGQRYPSGYPGIDNATGKLLPEPQFAPDGKLYFVEYVKGIRNANMSHRGLNGEQGCTLQEAKAIADRIFPPGSFTSTLRTGVS